MEEEKIMEDFEETNCLKTIDNTKDLVYALAKAENDYKYEKFETEQKYYKKLLNTDWDKINEERKEKGLSKLSNQDMKKAYIMTEMKGDYANLLDSELTYNELRRLYDISMKFSFDIFR